MSDPHFWQFKSQPLEEYSRSATQCLGGRRPQTHPTTRCQKIESRGLAPHICGASCIQHTGRSGSER
ncbi:hypothetical protein ABTC69_18455, partial [Acinetobacter baumannii]